MPGNDDAIRAIDLFCTLAANACSEGAALHQAELVAQKRDEPARAPTDAGPKSGRRVVEIKQQPRRGRSQGSAGGGKSYSAGGGKGDEASPKASAPAAPSKAASPAPAAAQEPAATSAAATPTVAVEEGEKKA